MQLAQDDAAQTASIATLFHHAVDVLAGVASDTGGAGWVRADGQMGPAAPANTYYAGADGNLYPRGASTGAPVAQVAGVTITPGMILLGLLAYVLLRK